MRLDLVSAIVIVVVSVISRRSVVCDAKWRKGEENIKEAVYLSPKFELGNGGAIHKFFYGIDFPKGHVSVRSFSGELVDEYGNSVPLYETYLHHFLLYRYYQREGSTGDKDVVLARNSGPCPGDLFAEYLGFGSEARSTQSEIPGPFGIESGNPEKVPEGYKEIWVLNTHVIDMRGVEDLPGCTECRCNLYNVTVDKFGRPLRPDYVGGFLCCYDNTECKVKEGVPRVRKTFYMRYKVKWVDWDDLQIPLTIYVLDVTDTVTLSRRQTQSGANVHTCRIEYDVDECQDKNDCLDVRRTAFPMEKGGYLIYGVGHQHTGGTGSALYGQDGRTLCESYPRYGTGKEPGNEEGFIVEMTSCYPEPGSVKINDGEIVIQEFNTSRSEMHTGLMGVWYLLVADRLPQQQQVLDNKRRFSRASLLEDLVN